MSGRDARRARKVPKWLRPIIRAHLRQIQAEHRLFRMFARFTKPSGKTVAHTFWWGR